ncbi:MAG TPA: hypothetical protein VHD38_00395 [Candidatus Paceibacterota bacterium]|jgi:hypothetical protein|nr:hypothetical protein [Candidatus Paceibacterota bacterium]
MPEHALLRWSAYEHEHIERGQDWYWALGVAAISIAVISILLGDFLFGVLIIVAAVTIALHSRKPPEITTIELSDRGIRLNDQLHRYREIICFWVEDEHDHHRPLLLVDTKKFLSPNLVIPIEHVDPRTVRAYLQERVKEKQMKEPMAHKILEFFGL